MKTNKIICGDCLDYLKGFEKESIDLIYLDPPFHSGKNYDSIWENGYEVAHFKDKAWQWYTKDGKRVTGIYAYLGWLEERVRECYGVLKSTGSLYLHCDYHANAHIRLMLDRVFGKDNFRNEIVWCHYGGGQSKMFFPRKHDNIYFYTKTKTYNFNADNVRVPYDSDYKATVFTTKGGRKKDKVYHKNPLGKVPEDFWIMNRPYGKEHLGYPTQKPEKLLDRIIKASSNEGDIILDPMCGGGTTIAVAKQLGRRWIGIDISPTACRKMMKRMNDLDLNIKETYIEGYPVTEEQLIKLSPLEFENFVRVKLHAIKPKDKGIDAITQEGLNWLETEITNVGIQIKRRFNVGRAIVEKLKGDIEIHEQYPINKKNGIIVGFSFSRDAIDRAAEFKQKYNIDIKLLTVSELIKYVHKVGQQRYW